MLPKTTYNLHVWRQQQKNKIVKKLQHYLREYYQGENPLMLPTQLALLHRFERTYKIGVQHGHGHIPRWLFWFATNFLAYAIIVMCPHMHTHRFFCIA